MPIGAGTTYTPNAQGGSANAIVVSHTHSLTDPGHFHSTDGTNGANTFPVRLGYDGIFDAVSRYATPDDAGYLSGTRVGTASTGITIAASGSSGTNANLPPYIGIYFIIKA
jgi:hypothetical protein